MSLCASVVLAQGCDWTGTWDIGVGRLVLQQDDNNVTGSLDDYQVQGTVSGNNLTANWERPGASGTLDFTMADDCQSFSGYWPYGPIPYDYSKYGYYVPLTGTRVEVEVEV